LSSPARFFAEGTHALGDVVSFAAGDAHKIAVVLRLRDGDVVEIFDSAAHSFDACLVKDCTAARLSALRPDTRGAAFPTVTVAQSLPKGQKMDFVVEKLTELGVAAIVPMHSQRTVAGGVSSAKLARWQRLAEAAAEQCGRHTVPSIESPTSLAEVVARFAQFDAVLFPWEVARGNRLDHALVATIARARSNSTTACSARSS